MPPKKPVPVDKEAGEDQAAVEPDGAVAPIPPHLDDQRSRQHVVHLTPRVKPGRQRVSLTLREAGTFVFRRGSDKPDLEHVIKLTPPQARQLRVEHWTVLEKE